MEIVIDSFYKIYQPSSKRNAAIANDGTSNQNNNSDCGRFFIRTHACPVLVLYSGSNLLSFVHWLDGFIQSHDKRIVAKMYGNYGGFWNC